MQVLLGGVGAVQDAADELSHPPATVLHHPQPPGAKKNWLAPPRIMEVWPERRFEPGALEESQAAAGEVFLEGEVEEAEGVVAALDEEAGHLPHLVEEAIGLPLRVDDLGTRGGGAEAPLGEADLGELAADFRAARGAAGLLLLQP